MADSKRQRIVNAITARMQAAFPALTVHDWRIQFQDSELPAISVCDLPATAAEESQSNIKFDRTIWVMPIQIRYYAKQETTPANIRTAIADIQAAVRQDPQFKVGEEYLVMESRPETEGFIIPEDSFEVVGGSVQFNAIVKTRYFNAEQ